MLVLFFISKMVHIFAPRQQQQNNKMTKQIKIKGKRIFLKTLKNNIIKAYDGTSYEEKMLGFKWYNDAKGLAEEMSHINGLEEFKNAGIIAALSPLASWERNKETAILFAKGVRKGLHTSTMIKKAEAIINAANFSEVLEILKGDKIRAFASNILFYDGGGLVTIDRHAISVAYGREIKDKERPALTRKQYEFISNAYILASKELGTEIGVNILPHELQAVTWVNFRIKKQKID